MTTNVMLTSNEVDRRAAIHPLERPREYFSWGRYPRAQHESVYKVYWTDQVEAILADQPSRLVPALRPGAKLRRLLSERG